MRAVLEIDMTNDAFAVREIGTELARILRGLAGRVDGSVQEDGNYYGCHDLNGNNVGRLVIEE